MKHSPDFYRRLIIGCFTRSVSRSLTFEQIQDIAGRIIENPGAEELSQVLDDLVTDGTLAVGQEAGTYEIRRYH